MIELAVAATISFDVFAATLTLLVSIMQRRTTTDRQTEVEPQARQTSTGWRASSATSRARPT